MKLSMDIIAECLRPDAVFRSLQPKTDRTLVKAEFHVPGARVFDPRTLYMARAENAEEIAEMPRDCSAVILNCPQSLKKSAFKHLSVLGLGGDGDVMESANKVLGVFDKFRELNKSLNKMIQEGAPLTDVIDLATDIVGVPLCMIDTFHNVLALSTKLEPKGDKFWDVMREGFGYGHNARVQESEPKLSAMVEGQPVEMLSNIGGNIIRVTLLFKSGQPIAALGMHKMVDAKKPFEKHQIHLYEYVIEKLLERLQLFNDVKVGRGLIFERFLGDILDGKAHYVEHVHRLFQEIGQGKAINYYLGVISFIESKHKTDLYLTVLNYVEVAVPNSRCVIKDNEILMVWPVAKGEIPEARAVERLTAILKRYNCMCISSTAFSSLAMLPKVNEQLHDIIEFLDPALGGPIHRYHNYAKFHAIKLLSKVTSLEAVVHPAIEILRRHDAAKKLDYLGTLKVYLRSNCRAQAAAKQLNMHRNSLVNRINQIETILGCSFGSNWKLRSQLIFAFDCVEYIEKHIKSLLD